SGGGLELDNVELAVPLLALGELGFRGTSIVGSGDGAGVLGSEPRLPPLRASAPYHDPSEQRDDDDGDDDDDQQTGVHGVLLSGTWMRPPQPWLCLLSTLRRRPQARRQQTTVSTGTSGQR